MIGAMFFKFNSLSKSSFVNKVDENKAGFFVIFQT